MCEAGRAREELEGARRSVQGRAERYLSCAPSKIRSRALSLSLSPSSGMEVGLQQSLEEAKPARNTNVA